MPPSSVGVVASVMLAPNRVNQYGGISAPGGAGLLQQHARAVGLAKVHAMSLLQLLHACAPRRQCDQRNGARDRD